MKLLRFVVVLAVLAYAGWLAWPFLSPFFEGAGPEAAAPDDGAGTGGEFAHLRLRQRFPARAHQQPRARIALGRRMVDRPGQHVGAHHHAGAAAGRRVVDGAVAAEAEVTDRHGGERPDVRLERLARER